MIIKYERGDRTFMKTLVFKLDRLSKTDLQSIEEWIQRLRWVWNHGLELLIELDSFSAVYTEKGEDDKKTYHRFPCCPVPWQYRKIEKDKPWEPGNLAPYTYFARKRPYAQFCPLKPVYKEPRLDNPSNFSVAKYFAHKRHPDKPWLKEIPAWFIRGTCHSLTEAWQRYKSGKARKPKFKSKNDVTDTLIHEDPKCFKVEPVNDRDGLIRIPKLGVFRVKHLWKDWGDRPIKVLKIAKKPDGYYLQLTGEFESKPLKPNNRAIALKFPLKDGIIAESDSGRQYIATQDVKLAQRIEKLQQQLSRQVYLSKNWHKTKTKIARLHALQARRRLATNQKISTFLCRTYQSISIQKPAKIAYKRAKKNERAKTLDPIHYDPNGANSIAEANKTRLSIGAGQFIALVKQKGRDRTITTQ